MKLRLLVPLLLASAALPAAPAAAQADVALSPGATRLDLVATGEVSRVPDEARIGAGVVTSAANATAALAENARRMSSVRAALKAAGIADRDIQTSAINLYPDYRQDNTGTAAPQIIGYRASNEVTVRFRDLANAGRILDALVSQGANQINGPSLSISNSDAAMDEARQKALATARGRAELYARSLGKRVTRILSISEAGGGGPYPPRPMAMARMAAQDTTIDPGEQSVSASVSVSFELQ
jgi:uncharacterized protein YggE